jgi:hypothetical protein
MNQVDKRQVVSVGFLFVLLLSFSAFFLNPVQAITYRQAVVNGDFETGTLTGWDASFYATNRAGEGLNNSRFLFTTSDISPHFYHDFNVLQYFNTTIDTNTISDASVWVLGGAPSTATTFSMFFNDSSNTIVHFYPGDNFGYYAEYTKVNLTIPPNKFAVGIQIEFVHYDYSGIALRFDNVSVLTSQDMGTVAPPITPAPTASPGTINIPSFNWISLRLDLNSILEVIIGAILTILGVAVLMRAQGAWIIGLILLVAGFFMQEIAQPNLSGVLAFAVELIASAIFLYNSAGSRKQK